MNLRTTHASVLMPVFMSVTAVLKGIEDAKAKGKKPDELQVL